MRALIAAEAEHRYHRRHTNFRSIGYMDTITISPKFQVVIPKGIREALKLMPGQKIQAIQYEDRIELVPVRPIRKMKGFLKGIDTNVPREDDRV